MITEENAIEIAKQYLASRNRNYISIGSVFFDKGREVIHGKYEDEIKDLFTVSYDIEGYQSPTSHFITIEAETGEVLFTATPHGFAEEWED